MGSRLEKNSNEVRKRIEGHTFEDERGEEYSSSTFGGFTDYMRRKKIKLQNLDAELRSQSSDNPQIFRGIVVHVNGYTQPSLSDLHGLVVSHGGGFMQYLDGKTAVTHVIASNLTPKKKVEFAKYRIVRPAWIVESVNAGRCLPWESFRLVDEGVTQKVLGFDGGKIVSQANTQRSTYKDQSDTSWYASQVRGMTDESRAMESADPQRSAVKSPETTRLSALDRSSDNEQMVLAELDQDDKVLPPSDQLLEEDIEQEVAHGNGQIIDPAAATTSLDPPPVEDGDRRSPEKRQLTAEEHNAILLQNPHMAKSSTANPDFINQYYRESRLHHLSTWKSELKAQLQARAAERSSQKPIAKRPPGSRRYILHIDFDSFFAAVSLRQHPHLKDQPVVIAHGSGPGSEIASSNYVARDFGIKNGMWMKNALQLCSNIKVLPYDYKAYEEASRHFYDSILDIEGVVQSISIDEALLDVSQQCYFAGKSDGKANPEDFIEKEQAKALDLATRIRDLVRNKTACEVSVGIGNNILLAKVALRKAKPAGQFLVKPEDILDILADLRVVDLPGVAWSIGNKLEEIGIKLVKDIRATTKERLISTLGPKTGEKLWDYARGVDRVEVGEQVIRKSVSAEINWGIRFVTQAQAEEFVQNLCDELQRRLLENLVKGRQLTMKIMRKSADAGMDPPKNLGHGKCDTFNKSVVLGVATYDSSVLGKEAISIMRSYGFPPGELRGLGVQMQKLEPLKQPTATVPALMDGSQRRLQFKKPLSTPRSGGLVDQPSEMPSHSRIGQAKAETDPIDDRGPHPVGEFEDSRAVFHASRNDEESDGKLLNISGTQFLLPTQIDPSVLAELPLDIRKKLAPKHKQLTADAKVLPMSRLTEIDKSRSASPNAAVREDFFPSHSQLDPEILDALPADLRDEVLAQYTNRAGSPFHARGQGLLPQSPRKAKVIPSSRRLVITPTKKNKMSNFLSRSRQRTGANSETSTLTQSNFVSVAKGESDAVLDDLNNLDSVTDSFLDELPAEIRIELQAEQKRQRLRSKAGLAVSGNRKRKTALGDIELNGQTRLILPPQPKRPTFTSRKLNRLSDLRTALSAWVAEFSHDSDEGPYEEDVAALAEYLRLVVLEEHDIAKAVDVVRWLRLVVDREDFKHSVVHDSWLETIDAVQNNVSKAVEERGMPPVAFD